MVRPRSTTSQFRPARECSVHRWLPPHLAGLFEEPLAFQQVPGGPYYIFDRRAHTVFTVDSDRTSVRKLVEIGQEAGRIIQPSGFDVAPDGTSFVVADAPRAQERIQFFGPAGLRTGGFFLPGRPTPGVSIGSLVLNGVGSLQHTGSTLLISHPESGALFTEYGFNGWPLRSFGRLRATGHEGDRDLHHTLNAGLPLVDPTAATSTSSWPAAVFRKYDQNGMLVFERPSRASSWMRGSKTCREPGRRGESRIARCPT